MSAAAARGPVRPRTRGPIEFTFEVAMGLIFAALFAWFVGLMIEIIGSYTLWKGEGVSHAQALVRQDLAYIAAAPRSLLVDDTEAFAQMIVQAVEMPYARLGIIALYLKLHPKPDQPSQDSVVSPKPAALPGSPPSLPAGLQAAARSVSANLSQWLVISMYVAQDVLLRMSVALFALPAFVLSCLIGTVDGLVRRDLRRWGGGRESSFVYHHAKRYTGWALTGGFSLYLSWPFGGFNPAYMVLVFTVLVAATLSTTVAAFKKYL